MASRLTGVERPNASPVSDLAGGLSSSGMPDAINELALGMAMLHWRERMTGRMTDG